MVVGVGELESGEGNDAPPCAPATAIPDLPAPLTPVQTAAAQIAAAGLATEREALRLAQISLEREDQEGYVQDQIQHALTDPGIHNRAAAFKANVEAGRTFVPPPGRRPQGLTILPALPLPLADVADTPVAADPRPDRVPDPAQAACAGIWQQASVYLRALYPHEYATALRYATLAELDLAGGIAQLIVPNEGQRRIVAGLADGVALALQQTGQPPLHIVVATHQADPLRPSRSRSLA